MTGFHELHIIRTSLQFICMKYKVMMSTKEQNAAICLFDLVN